MSPPVGILASVIDPHYLSENTGLSGLRCRKTPHLGWEDTHPTTACSTISRFDQDWPVAPAISRAIMWVCSNSV